MGWLRMGYTIPMATLLACILLQTMPAVLEGLSTNGGGHVHARPQREATSLRIKSLSTSTLRNGLAMRIRGGGFDPFEAVSPVEDELEYNLDGDLMAGDIARLNHVEGQSIGGCVDPDQFETLKHEHASMAEQVRLTQMFLILQNERIKSLIPGGLNCSYADSWGSGVLWDDPSSEFKWTSKWEDMPPVWKRIMVDSWNEFQEFLAMVALPHSGRDTAKFREFEQSWQVMQAAYVSNVNRAFDSMDGGNLRREVEERQKAVKKVMDIKSSEQKPMNVVSWCAHKFRQISRVARGEETEEDRLEGYKAIEVQLFGITLFNTKDPLSERLWTMAVSQGATVTAWPVKFLAWVFKKLERDFIAPLPPKEPVSSGTHVVLNNTKYQAKYYQGEVDLRRHSAIDHLHNYIKDKLNPGYDDTVWNSVRDAWEADLSQRRDGDGDDFRTISLRSPDEFDKLLAERIMQFVLDPLLDEKARKEREGEMQEQAQAEGEAAAEGSEENKQQVLAKEMAARLASFSIDEPRKEVEKVFKYGGGGDLRMVARSLGITLPGTMREWLDDPKADEDVMRQLLVHPIVQGILDKKEAIPEPVLSFDDE